MTANKARPKAVRTFQSRDLTDSTELGHTDLGRLIVALPELCADKPVDMVMAGLQDDMPDLLDARERLIDMIQYLGAHTDQARVRNAAEVLAGRLRNQRLG